MHIERHDETEWHLYKPIVRPKERLDRRTIAASSAGPSYGLPGQPEITGNAGGQFCTPSRGQYPTPVDNLPAENQGQIGPAIALIWLSGHRTKARNGAVSREILRLIKLPYNNDL